MITRASYKGRVSGDEITMGESGRDSYVNEVRRNNVDKFSSEVSDADER